MMGMAKALALDHIVLVVGDVERTLAWYGHYAGLTHVRVQEWRRGDAPFPSLRVDDQTIIDLVPRNPGDAAERGRLDHICLVVSPADLATLADDPELEILEQGTRFGARGNGQSIYVRDPDGLVVEFRTYGEG